MLREEIAALLTENDNETEGEFTVRRVNVLM